jgi:hypothetical protein
MALFNIFSNQADWDRDSIGFVGSVEADAGDAEGALRSYMRGHEHYSISTGGSPLPFPAEDVQVHIGDLELLSEIIDEEQVNEYYLGAVDAWVGQQIERDGFYFFGAQQVSTTS